jgi:hypothetical protein
VIETAKNGAGPGALAALGQGTVLGLVVVMVMLLVMVMMVSRGGERRAGKHQEQEDRGKNFLHSMILRRSVRGG